MSNTDNFQSWPKWKAGDHRPLIKFWDKTFGSPSLDYETALLLCEFYGFRASVCNSFVSLRQCLDVVNNLFTRAIVFDVVNENCKAAVLKFLGLSEPKSFSSGAVVRKLAVVFSSFEDVLGLDFSDSGLSSLLGKDVLRIFQATCGVPILDIKYSKASHLGYLTHVQRVIRGEIGVCDPVGCTSGDVVPVDVSGQNSVVKLIPGPVGVWTLSLPDENSLFYETASDGLLLFLALLSGSGDSAADWAEDLVVDFVRYVECDGGEVVKRLYLSSVCLRQLVDADLLVLLSLFAHKTPVVDAAHAVMILISIGGSGDVFLVREDSIDEDVSASTIPTRSVLASAARRGLPVLATDVTPLCISCPGVDPATEEGWIERQAARGDYRLWDVNSLRDWFSRRVHHSQVGVLKHTVLMQISAWLSGKTVDGGRRLSPSEPEVPFPPVVCHNTRQFVDDVGSRVFSLSTVGKLSLYVLQAEMAVLCPSFSCSATEKTAYVKALLSAFPIRAFGEAKRNSWLILQRSKTPVFHKCIWPPLLTQNVLVALPFFDSADEGAEPVIAYYSLIQQYQGEDIVLLSVVNVLSTVPRVIFMSKGDLVAIHYSASSIEASGPSVCSSTGSGDFSSIPQISRVNYAVPPSTLSVFPVGGFGVSVPAALDSSDVAWGAVGAARGHRSLASVDAAAVSGLTLVAREQPSRAKGDRTLKALMIADTFVRMVSVDPVRVLGTVMAEVFLSLVTHTGILTQLALVEVTQLLQSVNFPSYALAIPLTMSSRHDITQALTTAKLFVGWRSEEAFPESRAARFDYRSNDPLLVYRVLWTIFRVRYGFFEFHTEIWDALVRYASRCEKVVRDLFHWTQEAVDFMIKKALRDLEMLDDRVGLTVPSALVAPSPDAVQACPILDRFAYRDAIDLLPDMRDPSAYYTHHQLVMRAQQLHSEGSAVRYVVPLVVVPPFKVGGRGGKPVGLGVSAVVSPPLAQGTSTGASKKDRSATFLKKRSIHAVSAAGTIAAPTPAATTSAKRSTVATNRPCHQWLSTVGCSRGTCRFDHAPPFTKSIWISCRDELVKMGLTAGPQMGACPSL